MRQQLSVWVNLLTEIKLNEKFGKLKTEDRGIDGSGEVVSDPRILDCDPSARVTVELDGLGLKVESRLELPVM